MKTNIIYIHSHDTGRYIQPYGHGVPTPAMQQFAEDGVLYRKAFTAAPTCSPSRACLLTGCSAHSNGMLGLAHRGWKLNDYNTHLGNVLKKNGYKTALSGIQHIASGENDQDPWQVIGYDKCLCPNGRDIDKVSESAAEYIQREHESPFFLSIGFFHTHRPFEEPSPEENPNYIKPPAPLPDLPEVREDMAGFNKSAKMYDKAVEKLLQAVDDAGLRENTLVIITTDHGIPFNFMKCNLTDHGTGVMLMMRGPGGFSGGKAIDGMVSQIDLFPTICDVLEIDKPDWLEGKSLLPLVSGDVEEVNEEIYGEVNYHAAYEPMRSVRTKRWKYIRRYDYRTRGIMPNSDDGLSKSALLDYGLRERPVAEEQLYDLIFDPNESCNLATQAEYQAIKKDMSNRLQDWMERTNDPLLDGPIQLVPGGITNEVDSLSPGNHHLVKK